MPKKPTKHPFKKGDNIKYGNGHEIRTKVGEVMSTSFRYNYDTKIWEAWVVIELKSGLVRTNLSVLASNVKFISHKTIKQKRAA